MGRVVRQAPPFREAVRQVKNLGMPGLMGADAPAGPLTLSLRHSQGVCEPWFNCQALLTCPLLRMPLGPERFLQCLLVVRVLKFSVLPFEGPADPHRPNGHPSLRSLGCSRGKMFVSK